MFARGRSMTAPTTKGQRISRSLSFSYALPVSVRVLHLLDVLSGESLPSPAGEGGPR